MPQTVSGEGYRDFSEPRFFECETIAQVSQIRNPVEKAHAFIAPSDGGACEIWKFHGGDDTTADGVNIIAPTNPGASGRWRRLGDKISVVLFGAVGDGVEDDTAAIQAAATAMGALASASTYTGGSRPTIVFPAGAGYRITSGVSVPSGVNVEMLAPIIYDSENDEVALTVGEDAKTNYFGKYQLRVRRSSVSDWLSEDSVAIRVVNSWAGDIDIADARGFTIGAQCMGAGSGFGYNTVRLGQLIDNKIAIDLTNKTSSAVIGWCNQNTFLGGSLTCNTSTNTGKDRYGVRITSLDGTYLTNNNNVFYNPSIELRAASATPGEALPLLVEHGRYNKLLDARDEANGSVGGRFENASIDNRIHFAYSDHFPSTAENDGSEISNVVTQDALYSLSNLPAKQVFASGPLHKTACFYDATKVNVPRVFGNASTDAVMSAALAGITINAEYLEFTSSVSLGVLLDTSLAKRFIITKDCVSGYGGRIMIRCYDAAGSVITDAGSVKPTSLTFASAFGGRFRTSVDSNGPQSIEVSSAVAKVAVMLCGGTNSIRLRTFSIFSLDGKAAACWPGYEEVTQGANIGTEAPTSGTWERGRRVLNATPSAAGVEGWVCVTAGTPGTWKEFGSIAS